MATSVISKAANRLPAKAAAEAVGVGDLVYLTSSGTYALADADASGKWPAVGIVTVGAAQAAYPEVCEWAELSDSDWSLTVGDPQYLSDTGTTTNTIAPSATKPATTGDCVQWVGFAITATSMRIHPRGYYLSA